MIDRRRLISTALPSLALLGLYSSQSPWMDGASVVQAQHKGFGEQPDKPEPQKESAPEAELSPEEKMKRRYPQPVRVGFLIGLPMLDWQDSTIGFVQDVVRTPEGKIQLVMPYGGWFGRGGRPIAVPIETVAILARQIAVLDIGKDDFDKTPTWNGSGTQAIGRDETIRIAVTRR
jgi:hypothetical protein